MVGRALAACLFLAGAASWMPIGYAQTGVTESAGGLRLAQSALLVVDAQVQGRDLALSVRRARDQVPVSTQDASVSVDGKTQRISRGRDGRLLLPLDELGGGSHQLQLIIGHDGIRELLSGTVNLPEAGSSSPLGNYKQLAWWVLNIIIILIAAMMISRRKS